MNKQGPDKIDWTDYTWNPISGCKHGCPYCYMLRMESRFPGIMKPAFNPKRLHQPISVQNPSMIFTGSSGDMWGEWVDKEWIDDVLDVCTAFAPQHTYQFLTKNPSRYGDFYCIKNGWYGTTVDGTERTKNNINDLVYWAQAGMAGRFVSFEPLLAPVDPDLFGIQWVIIGADSTRGAKKPPKAWADTIIEKARASAIPVFIKNNYGYPERIKEMPQVLPNNKVTDTPESLTRRKQALLDNICKTCKRPIPYTPISQDSEEFFESINHECNFCMINRLNGLMGTICCICKCDMYSKHGPSHMISHGICDKCLPEYRIQKSFSNRSITLEFWLYL